MTPSIDTVDRRGLIVTERRSSKKANVLSVRLTIKGVLKAVRHLQDVVIQLQKWACRANREAFKRRLGYSVTVRIST